MIDIEKSSSIIKMLEITPQENCFRSANFDLLSHQELIETLGKWLKEHRRNRRDPNWNSLVYTLATLIMPDVEMNQLLISYEFFVQKMFHLLGLSTFKTETLFNGVQIKITQTFIAFDTECKLQKVILEGTQIKEVTPTQAFTMIKREQVTCEDRKKRMFIYSRQKTKSTTFLTVQLKVLERTKNEMFKQDHLNKMKFFTDYVFGEYCPSFCVSGINMMEIKENEWLNQKTHLHSNNIYLIYQGTFVCFLEKEKRVKTQKCQEVSEINISTKRFSRVYSAQKTQRGLTIVPKHNQPEEFISKIELNKGSIIESSSFQDILATTNQLSTHVFQSCKAVTDSILFEIKCSEFYRALCTDERCREYFMSQYQKVFNARRIMMQQSLQTLNKFFTQNEQKVSENQLTFSIARKKHSNGFRTSRSQKSNFDETENIAAVQIYNTMIRNKEKVLSLQNQYKERNNSLKEKTHFRYEDCKKLKDNYKRMKIKDFQIQKLVFSNSMTNMNDPTVANKVKSRFGQVKGMFEEEIEDIEKIIEEQRKTTMSEENKQNREMKRKGKKLKSCYPEESKPIFVKQNMNYSKTCHNSNRVSLNQNLNEDALRALNEQSLFIRNSASATPVSFTNKSMTKLTDVKVTVRNIPGLTSAMGNRGSGNNSNGHGHVHETKNVMFNLGNNRFEGDKDRDREREREKSARRTGKKVKTFCKHSRKPSNNKSTFNYTLSSIPL